PVLLKKLAKLRRRERSLTLVWGLALVVGIALAALIAACIIDWTVDLWDDTPWTLRLFMLRAQVALLGLTVLLLVVWPQLRRYRNERLALQVEAKRPELQQRLISALELNRPDARTAGMSAELMAVLTQEAEEKTRPINFAALADHRRLKRSAWV